MSRADMMTAFKLVKDWVITPVGATVHFKRYDCTYRNERKKLETVVIRT